MKNLINILTLFSFSIFFFACNNKNIITPPPPPHTTIIQKQAKQHFSISKISVDSLAKEEINIKGRTFIINLTGIRKEKLIKYLSTHKISKVNSFIQPNYFNCGEHITFYWEAENQFRSKPGKYLGIWTNKVNWTKLHDQYGFTNILTSFSSATAAIKAHFKQDSIMINLGYNATWDDINNNPAYKYYYVDEPEQRSNSSVVLNYSIEIQQKSPSSKLLMSDYYWPNTNLLCLPVSGDLETMLNLYLPNSNEYIMCDQYDGNLCADVHSFWDEYKADYGIPSKNLTNWITLKPGHSHDWGDLLNVAMSWSAYGAMNPIWIYGYDVNINESTISSFSATAWTTGWLERKFREYEVFWKCDNPNPCVTCDWNDPSSWYVYAVYPLGEQWF